MRKWIAPSIVVAAVVVTVIVFPNLPPRIPVHWSLSGEADGWSSRAWGASILPLMLAGFWAMMRWLPLIDPRRENYAKFAGAFQGIIILIMLFLFGLQLLILAAGLGRPVSMERIAPGGIGLLLIGIGNLLPRARSNWFIGIRTPWTLSSDRVWERTHRLGGYLFVISGALAVAAALAAPRWAYRFLAVAMGALALTLIVYSYVAWRRDAAANTQLGGSLPPSAPRE